MDSIDVAFTRSVEVELSMDSIDVSIINSVLEFVELSETSDAKSGSIVTLTPLFEFKWLVRSSFIIPENENSSAYAEP